MGRSLFESKQTLYSERRTEDTGEILDYEKVATGLLCIRFYKRRKYQTNGLLAFSFCYDLLCNKQKVMIQTKQKPGVDVTKRFDSLRHGELFAQLSEVLSHSVVLTG